VEYRVEHLEFIPDNDHPQRAIVFPVTNAEEEELLGLEATISAIASSMV
jgi:hypothetical protein